MSLKGIAQETLSIVDAGSYVAPSGRTVSVRAEVEAAVRGTVLYRPEQLGLSSGPNRPASDPSANQEGARFRRLSRFWSCPPAPIVIC